MKIFLSYASEDRPVAEQIALALGAQGHDVFFDREDLPPGDDFHGRIRRAIEGSDQFVFLISPHALDKGSYTLNELEIAQKTWRHPARRVLPVLLSDARIDQLPNYLKSVTVLQTDGNVPAMVADAIHRIGRSRRRTLLTRIAAGATGLAVLAIAAALHWSGRAPAQEVTGRDGAPALLVAAGAFTMGDDDNSPRREIYTDTFYIDKFEITTARYAAFMKATGSARTPEGWEGVELERAGELPVTGVTWHEAHAYCKWAGRRLPTETEWEKAARGTDGRLYPWGSQSPDLDRANFANTSPNAYDGGLARFGSHPAGKSPYGVHDMAGNAAEWVADWYAASFPRGETHNPQGPDRGDAKVVRGGGRFDAADRIASTRRYFANPGHRSEEIGFRCAR